MQELAGKTNIHAGVLALSRSDRWGVIGVWTWNVDMEAMGRYMTEEMAGKDELMEYVMAAEPGHFYNAALYLGPSAENSRYGHVYNNWIEPMGFKDVAIAAVPSGHTNTVIGLYRREEQGEFSHGELQQLDRLVPHVARALRLHGELVQQQGKLGDLQGWLSLIKVPVLLFDENFQCREQNAAARAMFDSLDGMWLRDGFIEFNDSAVTSQVHYQILRTVKAALGQLDSPLTSLSLQLNEGTFNLFFMPVEDAGDSAITSAGALVFIHPQSQIIDFDFTPLQAAFGLTEAELAVSTRLAQGLSLSEIAAQQDKSRETVRSQLKSIFAKTGATSQAELVVTLLTHPLVIGAV